MTSRGSAKPYRPVLDWPKTAALLEKGAKDQRVKPETTARAAQTAPLLKKFKPLRDKIAKGQAPNN